MSKYIKLEDALKAVRDNTMPLDCWHIDRMRAISSLPTIEVSEDAISREYLKSFEYINKGDFNSIETIREWIDNAPSVIPQVPSEDAISREAVLEIYSDLYWTDERLLNFKDELDKVYEKLRNAPPVIPQPKEGEWIYTSDKSGYIGNPVEQCSICGAEYEQAPFNYCPNCGARMKGAEDEID